MAGKWETKQKKKIKTQTHNNKIDAEILEIFDDIRFRRTRDGRLSRKRKCLMTGFRARFDYEFTNISGSTDKQNLALRCHNWNSIKNRINSSGSVLFFDTSTGVPWKRREKLIIVFLDGA